MSLQALTNQQILDTHLYRWPRICIHPDIWNIPKILPNYQFTQWQEVKFEKNSIPLINHLEGQEGIYMFIARPNSLPNSNHSFIMYIGETGNIKQRFEKYFTYKSTKHPSDQLKRRMVLVWKDYLYFQYITTNFGNRAARETLEYDLIDTIVPPMNDLFRSKILKSHLKSLKSI